MPRDGDGGDGNGGGRWCGTYILEGHTPVPAPTLVWGRWLETHQAERRVARTLVHNVEVSTVFLGIDMGLCPGEPLLFETMVFGGALDQEQERYTTWQQAELGHRWMMARVAKAGRRPSGRQSRTRTRAQFRAVVAELKRRAA